MPGDVHFWVEVQAGTTRGQPAFTQRFELSAREWLDAIEESRVAEALATLAGRALGCASGLMARPDQFPWVHVEWCGEREGEHEQEGDGGEVDSGGVDSGRHRLDTPAAGDVEG